MWWNEQPLNTRERTIGNILRDNGYNTGYFGKMHIDGKENHTKMANHFGFTSTFLSEDWQTLLASDHWDTPHTQNRIRKEFYMPMMNEKNPWVTSFESRNLHHEDVITDKAIEFLNRSTGNSFCVVSYNGPHPPYGSPPPYNTMYDRESFSVPDIMSKIYFNFQTTPKYWRELKAQYYGCVSWIDDNIGRLLKNVDDNTIIIFTSDHGDILGDHGLFSKGLYAYDGNVRVPLLMRFPHKEHAIYDHTVQSIDILPTILQSLGIKQPIAIQGKGLYNALWSNEEINQWAFSCIGHEQRLRMVRTPEFKYWWYGGESLFDLRGDPSEAKNIAHTNKDLLMEMRGLLISAMIQAEDNLPSVH